MMPWALVAAIAAAIDAETGEAVRVRWIRPVGPAASAGFPAGAAGFAAGPSPWALAGRQERMAANAGVQARPRSRAAGLDGAGGARHHADDGRTRG